MQITDCIIPAHNEEGQIEPLISQARQFVRTVYCVDDGSTDGTAQIAARAGAEVIRLGKRTGKGHALRVGMARALSEGAGHLLLMDADGQHDTGDIPRFLEESGKWPEAMIIGNRMGNATGMPLARWGTNRFMSFILSQWTGQILPDSQCGFRMIPAPLARQWRLESDYIEIESEMILRAAALGCELHSVPVRCFYSPGRQSRIVPLVDTWRWLRFMAGMGLVKSR